MATFKDRIKLIRNKMGKTQKEFGLILGLAESTISLYESGKREPQSANDYVDIANKLNVTLDYLLGRTDDEHTMVLTNKDLKVPEEYKDVDIEIGVDKDKYPKEGFTEEQVREIIKTLDAAGLVVRPKDKDK